jgi:surfeit locus 1 family protein
MRGRYPRLVPTLITIAIVLTCLGLGVWQLERLQGKRALIALRQAAIAAPPVAPPQNLEQALGMEFRHVADQGVFLNDKELYLGATSAHGGAAGFDVFTPLRETNGRVVFVNRGFSRTSGRIPRPAAPARLRAPSVSTVCCGCRMRTSPAGFCRTTAPT